MRLARITPLLLLLAAALLGRCEAAPTVRFDGLYADAVEDGGTSYIRFYADGTVVTVSSTGTAEQVASWISTTHDGVSKGRYSIRGAAIQFRDRSAYGEIDYKGVIEGDQLVLKVHSLINGYEAERRYRFVRCTFPPEEKK